ncbi:MAG: 50S ribosomal protein L1 [Patescibacteria group bacterium]
MKKRSKRYRALREKFESKIYTISEAIKTIKEKATAKFDESVEVHLSFGIDKNKGEQTVKGVILFPHSIGRKVKIAAFVTPQKEKEVKVAGANLVGGEELIKKIKETKKCDFDVAVAQPEMMRHLATVAKILGPKGLMPSPKTETVTTDPAKTVKELIAGKISFKTDPQNCLHQIIGKASFDEKKLQENFETLINAVKKAKPAKIKGEFIKSITLSSTMGPGIKIKV